MIAYRRKRINPIEKVVFTRNIAHNIAFAYERCRLGVEVGAVRLHHNRLYLALGMGLSPGSIVGAFLLWPLFRSF